MKQIVVAVTVVVFLGTGAAAAPRKEAKKDLPTIVGTWEIVSTSGDIPKGTLITFDKEMTVRVSIAFNGKTIDIEGTYKVEGDKLSVTIRGPDGKEEKDTDTIKSSTTRRW